MEEGDNVLCTVRDIQGTTVFVKIEDNGDGTIVVSEIAPGRIRNLRDYVIPGKKIVCKILQIQENNVNLSLRRVTEKEKKEVMEKFEKEKNSLSILKSVLKDKAEEVARNVKEKEKTGLYDFLQNCKDNQNRIEKYTGKEEAVRICKILQERKEKQIEVKKEFSLSSNASEGMNIIKKILYPYKEKITYLAAGRFVAKLKAENYKKANLELQKILDDIEVQAKKEKASFGVK